MLFRSSMGIPVISRHMANNRRRTRGTRGTSTRGRGSERGAQRASSSTRAIPQVLHDDDDDFMPPRSRRPANSSNDRNTNVTKSTTISANDDDDDDDFMPARSQRYQRSSEDPVDHNHADDESDPHLFDEFENIDGIYQWGRIPPIINPMTRMEMRELDRMFTFAPFD